MKTPCSKDARRSDLRGGQGRKALAALDRVLKLQAARKKALPDRQSAICGRLASDFHCTPARCLITLETST